eukprot:6177282-Pleurochrysis_carterae.AAC.1
MAAVKRSCCSEPTDSVTVIDRLVHLAPSRAAGPLHFCSTPRANGKRALAGALAPLAPGACAGAAVCAAGAACAPAACAARPARRARGGRRLRQRAARIVI